MARLSMAGYSKQSFLFEENIISSTWSGNRNFFATQTFNAQKRHLSPIFLEKSMVQNE